jgi:hypothetical protein
MPKFLTIRAVEGMDMGGSLFRLHLFLLNSLFLLFILIQDLKSSNGSLLYLQRPYALCSNGGVSTVRMGRTTISLTVKSNFLSSGVSSCFMPISSDSVDVPCLSMPDELLEILSVPRTNLPESPQQNVMNITAPDTLIPAADEAFQGEVPLTISDNRYSQSQDLHIPTPGLVRDIVSVPFDDVRILNEPETSGYDAREHFSSIHQTYGVGVLDVAHPSEFASETVS